jgi:pilus assembly protein Flp/PilA
MPRGLCRLLFVEGKEILSTLTLHQDAPDFHRSDLHFGKLRHSIVVQNVNHHGNPAMKKLVRRFLNDDSGATAIEYGLIAAGISVAIIAAVNTIGTNLNTTFSSISSQLK